MQKIVFTGDPVLHTLAIMVPLTHIESAAIKKILKSMQGALHKEKFGVAIAAPQIAVPLRIFIVSGHIFANRLNEEYDPKHHLDQVFINPEIVKTSKKKIIGDEGCLSIPGKYGTKVQRSEKVTITYHDENSIRHERGASSFLARVFQHEIDHLNGILYTDHALAVIDVDDNLKPFI